MAKNSPDVFETTFATYKRLSVVGSGGSGTVVRAKDDIGNDVAIKYLSPENVTSDKTRRFKNELGFCIRNDHPNVVKVLDHGHVMVKEVKCPFYVMPFFSGTLRSLLKLGMDGEVTIRRFAQILDGVEAAHLQGVCHRDLKPENILHDEEVDRLVIADFGIARFTEEFVLTSVDTAPGARLANFIYAAPEQRERGGQVDHRADIFALGLILNEMFTGRLAHGVGFAKIAAVHPSFAYLDDIVDSMLHQSPAKRPQSIREIKSTLIGRRIDFISMQALSELKKQVVPVTEVDDPLIVDPPVLTDARWDKGVLHLTLSRAVNRLWASLFANPGSHSAILGRGPETFSIQGNALAVEAFDHEAQQLITYTKQYIQLANQAYANRIRSDAIRKQREEEDKLRRRIAMEEKATAINARLKI